MRTIRLGRTDVEVSAISLGTWPHGGPNTMGTRPVGWSGHDPELARQALLECQRLGITHWDTADVYGNGRSEELIGSVWADVPRESIFLASKVGWDAGEFEHYYHPKQVIRQLDGSLRRMRTDVIDLFYLHHCDFGPDDRYLDEALELLQRAREAGKIRFIGLSDWNSERVMRIVDRVDPDVIQPYRNLTADSWNSSGMKQYAAQNDIGVAFFSPLRHGLLLGKYSEPTTFPAGDFRSNDRAFRDAVILGRLIEKRDRLRELFSGRPQPVLNALLGALLEDAPTACVLVGLRNPDQVGAAAEADEILASRDAERVRQLYSEL